MSVLNANSESRKDRPLTVLLTGAAGFIGSHLTDRLLRAGHAVVGVDNFTTGRRENIAHLEGHPRFRLIEQDASAPVRVSQRLDWVMHFASPASPPKYLERPVETLLVNGRGTFELLELARRHRARFFLASTSEVYGDPLQHPQPESYWGNVNPLGPRSVYDEAKRYAESLVMTYHRQYDLSVRIIRIFNTYGPRMDPYDGRVVTNFIRQALYGEPLTVYGDGSQTRSLQYVDDLIEGIVRYMRVDNPGPVNLGNPRERTVLDIARLVLSVTRSPSRIAFRPLPQNDPVRRRPDIGQARFLLDWQPRIDAREGLERTVQSALQREETPPLALPLRKAAVGVGANAH